MPDRPGDASPAKPPCSREDALAVVRRLREAGPVAYFAGGCVRDLLLGLEPKDYDVATDAAPQRVRQLFASTQAVGAAFGVILVRLGRSVVEVATFRTDGQYVDGRRPSEVTFTTAQEDAQRRDFTINGLFLDPLDNDRVVDYVGGQEDLKSRVLRAVGNAADRFKEDHLRLLRAVRFAARFGLTIDPPTAFAIRTHAPMLRGISPERVADELRRMLTPTTRATAWRLLWDSRLVEVIFRFLEKSMAHLKLDEARSIFLATSPDQPIPFGLALAAAGLELRAAAQGKPDDLRPFLTRAGAQQLVRQLDPALRLSNEEFDEAAGTLEGAGLLLTDEFPAVARLKRFLARKTSQQSRALLDAIAQVGPHATRVTELRPKLEHLARGEVAPPPLITGDDLAAAGLTPGPLFKRILDTTYDAQLEDRLRSKDQALAFALALGKQAGN